MSRRKSSSVQGSRVSNDMSVMDEGNHLLSNETIVRPSTSSSATRYAKSILSSNSSVSTELTKNWFNVLSESENSKLIRKTMEKYKTDNLNKDQRNSDESSEAESDDCQEPKKKRRQLAIRKNKKEQSAKKNLFIEAFDTTPTSSKKNPASIQEDVAGSSTSTSPVISKKSRPKIFKTAKSTEDGINPFKQILDTSSTSEITQGCSKTLILSQNENESTTIPTDSEKIEKAKKHIYISNRSIISPVINKHIAQSTNNTFQDKEISKQITYSNEKELDANTSLENIEHKSVSSELTTSSRRSSRVNIKNAIEKTAEITIAKSKKKFAKDRNNVSVILKPQIDESNISPNLQSSNKEISSTVAKIDKSASNMTTALHDIKNKLPPSITNARVVLHKLPATTSQNLPNKMEKDKSIIQSNLKNITLRKREKLKTQVPTNNLNKNVDTSSDDEIFETSIKSRKSKNVQTRRRRLLPLRDSESSDDLNDVIKKSYPAQSTLILHGEPLSSVEQPTINHITNCQTPQVERRNVKNRPVFADVCEDVDVEMETNDIAFKSVQANRCDKPTSLDDKINAFLSDKPSKTANELIEITSNIDPSVWADAKKKVDTMKEKILADCELEEQKKCEQFKRKAVIDAKLKRLKIKQEAEKKRKERKPLDKAFYVNGVPYKQPRLPKPKRWVTKKLYEYLWKHMEPKFKLRTRVKSEKFILKFSKIYDIIMKRKKYENYEADLNDLIVTMAKLGIIESRFDFHRFCSEFMPSAFNIKVIPMMLPGNVRNIPYDKETVFEPILNENGSSSSSASDSSNENPEKSTAENADGPLSSESDN